MGERAAHEIVAIRALRERGAVSLEVRPSVERAFGDEMRARLANTVWTSGCSSWYLAPNGEPLLWPGFTFDYWLRTRTLRLTDYELGMVSA